MCDRLRHPFVARDSGSTLVLMVVSILALGLVFRLWKPGSRIIGIFQSAIFDSIRRRDSGGCDLVRIALDLINARFLMNKEGT